MQLAGARRLIMLAIFAVAAVFASSGCEQDDGVGPFVDRALPDAAAPGATVEIVGERFCGDESSAATDEGTCVVPPAGFVSFGRDANVVRATIVEWKEERITLTVPTSANAGATLVVVTVDGVSSNAVDFEVE